MTLTMTWTMTLTITLTLEDSDSDSISASVTLTDSESDFDLHLDFHFDFDLDCEGECAACRNVGNNRFPWLPGAGLQRLLHLKAHNNPNLRHFHPPDVLPRIQVLAS